MRAMFETVRERQLAMIYELTGNTLLTHNIVAKAARNMTLTERVSIEQIDQDTFVATVPAGEPNAGRQTTYASVR